MQLIGLNDFIDNYNKFIEYIKDNPTNGYVEDVINKLNEFKRIQNDRSRVQE